MIMGYHKTRHHTYNCKTLYIPEDFDLDTALDTVAGATTQELTKRALALGATQSFLDSISDMDLKVYIIQKSIEEKHIATMEIEDKITEREASRAFTRHMSSGRAGSDAGHIQNSQEPEFNPHVMIDELRADFDENYRVDDMDDDAVDDDAVDDDAVDDNAVDDNAVDDNAVDDDTASTHTVTEPLPVTTQIGDTLTTIVSLVSGLL